MVIGGNDGWNMTDPSGRVVRVGTDAWVDEYARRVAAIMRTYLAGGVRRSTGPARQRPGKVCGTGCTARSTPRPPGPRRRWRERSTSTSTGAPPSTATTRRRCPSVGHLVQHARQPDGVHWTLDGSQLPASLELAAISGTWATR